MGLTAPLEKSQNAKKNYLKNILFRHQKSRHKEHKFLPFSISLPIHSVKGKGRQFFTTTTKIRKCLEWSEMTNGNRTGSKRNTFNFREYIDKPQRGNKKYQEIWIRIQNKKKPNKKQQKLLMINVRLTS